MLKSISSIDRKRKLFTLANAMNKQNERFLPVIPPLLDMLDLVITSEELDYLITMGPHLYTYEQAASLSQMRDVEFSPFFETLKRKGFINIKLNEKGEERYQLNPLATGWYELQFHNLIGKPEAMEFSKRANDFFSYPRKLNFFPFRNLQNAILQPVLKPYQSVGIMESQKGPSRGKKIEVNQSLSASGSKIYPTKTINDLIEEYGTKNAIALYPCMCRRGRSNLNDPCRFAIPDESCLGLGHYSARLGAKYGYGRLISKEEALDVIQEVRDNGAIHTVFHEKDDTTLPEAAICNCCWDCCGLFRSYNLGGTVLTFRCYYSALIVNGSDCTGCKNCESHCPTGAITSSDGRVNINSEICIGCGQCAHQCSGKNIIELIPNERNLFLPILKRAEARLTV